MMVAMRGIVLLAFAFAALPVQAVRVINTYPQTSIPYNAAYGLGTPDLPLDQAPLVSVGAS